MSFIQYPATQAQADKGRQDYQVDREIAFNALMQQIQVLTKLGDTAYLLPSPRLFQEWSLEELFVSQGYVVEKIGSPYIRIVISWTVAQPVVIPAAPDSNFEYTFPEPEDEEDELPFPWATQFTDTSEGLPTSWLWKVYNESGAFLFSSLLQNPIFTLTEGTYNVSLETSNLGGSNISIQEVVVGSVARGVFGTTVLAKASYSLRKTYPEYAGPAVRVRSTAEGAPEQDIGFTIDGILDAAALNEFVGIENHGYVTTWYDQSGNEYNLTQEEPDAQPQIAWAGIGTIDEQGYPHLFFPPGAFMTSPNISMSTNRTVMVVARTYGEGDAGTAASQLATNGWVITDSQAYILHLSSTTELDNYGDGYMVRTLIEDAEKARFNQYHYDDGEDFSTVAGTVNEPLYVGGDPEGAPGRQKFSELFLWDLTMASEDFTAITDNIIDHFEITDPRLVTPDANFTKVIQVVSGYPKNVTCTDTSTNTPTEWSWSVHDDFEDEVVTTSLLQNPVFALGEGGYTITLVAGNGAGEDSSSQNVVVSDTVFAASFTVDDAWESPGYPKVIACTDTSGPFPRSWAWTVLKDSEAHALSFVQNPNLDISEPGVYTISLIAGDGIGYDTSLLQTITITEQLPPVGMLTGYPEPLSAGGIRRLYTDYVGNLVSVRRADTAIGNIGYSGTTLDLDIATLEAFADGQDCFVTKIWDQSGNVAHWEQAVEGKQAKIVSDGTVLTINGKPTMLFDENTSYTRTQDFYAPRTVGYVNQRSEASDGFVLSSLPEFPLNEYGFALTNSWLYSGFVDDAQRVFGWSADYNIRLMHQTSTLTFAVEGRITTGPSAISIGNITGDINLGASAAGGDGAKGNVSEFYLWFADLDNTQLDNIVLNVQDYYGIVEPD